MALVGKLLSKLKHVQHGPWDCLEWQGSSRPDGYGQVEIDGKRHYVHRVFYALFVGDLGNGMFVCHRCDNPRCVNPDHLFLGTPADNINDAASKWRTQKGSKNHHAKLTEADVDEIIRRVRAGERQIDVAAAFGVPKQRISKILLRQAWQQETSDVIRFRDSWKKKTADEYQRVIELRGQGLTQKQIAKLIGTTQQTVGRMLQRRARSA